MNLFGEDSFCLGFAFSFDELILYIEEAVSLGRWKRRSSGKTAKGPCVVVFFFFFSVFFLFICSLVFTWNVADGLFVVVLSE